MAEKFASANVCAVGIDFVVYDPNIKDEEGQPSGLQHFLSLTWEDVIELVEGHEDTRVVTPELTDAALKLWGITGPPKVEGGVIDAELAGDQFYEQPTAEYLRSLADKLHRIPVEYGVDGYDVDRLIEIARELEGSTDGDR